MSLDEVTARGADARDLASRLLQRDRLLQPTGGIWEAADVQWWWRQPRDSDHHDQVFWVDDDGPVAGILLTSWASDRWQCDPLLISGTTGISADQLMERLCLLPEQVLGSLELNLRTDDPTFHPLVDRLDLAEQGRWVINWMNVSDRPPAREPGVAGYTITDHTARGVEPHPMAGRNGPRVAQRLGECSLYEPGLDLAVVEDSTAHVVGYALFWIDPYTRVGYVEPMRVEAAHQRRGLATALLSEGLDRLARSGAIRFKILHESPVAAALYHGVGFHPNAEVALFTRAGDPAFATAQVT